MKITVGTLLTGLLTMVHTTVAPWAQTTEQQQSCAQQAKRFVQELNAQWDAGRGSLQETTHQRDYQSHFNTKLRKCLVLFERNVFLFDPKTQTGFNAITVELTDAYERRVYATYWWQSHPTKKFWEVGPISCELVPSIAEKRTCSDRDEFDAFVSPYMQD